MPITRSISGICIVYSTLRNIHDESWYSAGMGLWNRLSNWLELSAPSLYRCVNCESRVSNAQEECPECGGEVEQDEETAYHYWGPV